MFRPAPKVSALHRPGDVAELLGCSEWWVKDQARKRRIPYARIGGSYRFTDEHIAEIIQLFEVRPDDVPSPVAIPRQRDRRSNEDGGQVVQLRARTPRRARLAAEDQAA